ncbi:MAG: zinc ribbon domain-containing protein [Chloroflexi bacterium]|nr:zinc ribbon domain-containing protein [Chloroflexota bacterium]
MQQWYKCPNCGAPVALGVRFCGNCGSPLMTVQQQSSQPQYQQPQQAAKSHKDSPEISYTQDQPRQSFILKIPKMMRIGGSYLTGGVLFVLFQIVQFAVPAIAGLSMILWAVKLFSEGSIAWGLLVLLIGTPLAIGLASWAAIFLFFIGVIAVIIWGIISLFGFGISFDSVWDSIWLVVEASILVFLAFYGSFSLCSQDWSQRHLNWTIVILWVTVMPLALIIAGVLGIPQQVVYLLVPLLILLVLLTFTGWALKQKNRSLWWLLLFIIPFLWLGLKNRSQQEFQ